MGASLLWAGGHRRTEVNETKNETTCGVRSGPVDGVERLVLLIAAFGVWGPWCCAGAMCL
ncbi:hypothetical protein GCM10025734_42610 [Kitasatospora paranensis]